MAMQNASDTLLQIAHPISGAAADYDPLLRLGEEIPETYPTGI